MGLHVDFGFVSLSPASGMFRPSAFGRQAVIGMCVRPYVDATDMDEDLLARWNAVVGPRDTVWHLGDFSMGPRGTAERVFRRLNGSIHLVRGNHGGSDVLSCRWASVHDVASQRVDGVRLVLCHYPMCRGGDRPTIATATLPASWRTATSTVACDRL